MPQAIYNQLLMGGRPFFCIDSWGPDTPNGGFESLHEAAASAHPKDQRNFFAVSS